MVSIVIPVYREEQRLPGCLGTVAPGARSRGMELIVVDGGSDDGTVDAAHRCGATRVIEAPRGRGSQMNAGAAVSRGSLLAFLPADTSLPDDGLEALATVDQCGLPLAGGFTHRFDRRRRLLGAVSCLHNLRSSLTGIFYGDQVPFVRRRIFLEMGGFRQGVDMEDVEFGARLRRRVRSRRLAPRVVTSARRFDEAGDLRATAEVLYLLFFWTLLRRAPPSRIFFSPVR